MTNKISKIKNIFFKKSIKNSNYSSTKTIQSSLINTNQSKQIQKLISFLNIEEFALNPQFVEISKSIDTIKTCGIVKLENLTGKRVEITTVYGEKLYATAFEKEPAETGVSLKKYLVVKPSSSVNALGKVWDRINASQITTFILENCPFMENKKLISVVSNGNMISEEVNFYTQSNKWFGKTWISDGLEHKDMEKTKNIKAILKSNIVKGLKNIEQDSTLVVLKTNICVNPLKYLGQNPLQILVNESVNNNIFESVLLTEVYDKENLTLGKAFPRKTQQKIEDYVK